MYQTKHQILQIDIEILVILFNDKMKMLNKNLK